MDLPTLQEIQDSFAAIANVKARITDADGNLLTQATPTKEFLRRQQAIEEAENENGDGDGASSESSTESANPAPGLAPLSPQRDGREYIAPIIVNNQRLGTIRMSAVRGGLDIDENRLAIFASRLQIDPRQLKSSVTALLRNKNNRSAAIQFLFLLANAIARLCFQEYQLRRRIDELTAVYNVAMMLSETRDLASVLQRTVAVVCEVMNVRASSIRLIDHDKDELTIKAVHNLSLQYIAKGPVRLSKAEIDHEALSPKGFAYVKNMADDPRVQYPEESKREGIVSMLSVGMRYKGRAIGVLRVYTNEEKHFSQLEIDLLRAIAAQAAAAIENTRLLAESLEAEQLERQVAMAVDVQQRMVPTKPPQIPGVDLASAYVPCYALGGDLFDFISFPNENLGLVVADVSGKGVPASLIMASVRASIRAYIDNLFYLYEIMRRVNQMLCRDTKPGEFVTLFYGVIDIKNQRLTYCNAGHPPPLLLRDGKVIELQSNNMVLGLDPAEPYQQIVEPLKRGDLLLLYTDGLTDTMNFHNEPYGKQRLIESFSHGGETAEAVAQRLLWDMRRYAGLTARTDDVTLIVAKVL
jgi:sigma-B regulation protein RsbU (phosphoserine phosphatase)